MKMPLVNIKLTGGDKAPTTEQKAALIKGVTELLVDILGKNPQTTHVIIEEIPLENWGIAAESVLVRNQKKV